MLKNFSWINACEARKYIFIDTKYRKKRRLVDAPLRQRSEIAPKVHITPTKVAPIEPAAIIKPAAIVVTTIVSKVTLWRTT